MFRFFSHYFVFVFCVSVFFFVSFRCFSPCFLFVFFSFRFFSFLFVFSVSQFTGTPKFSGLKPNYDKTSCIKLGSLKHANLEFETTYNKKWSQDPFSFLGITFTVDLSEIIKLNYRQKINDIRKMVNSWSKRNLSTLGRITLVKSLMIPKLTHLFISQSLPKPQKELLKEKDTLLFNYIWNSKVDSIARKYITRQ